LNEYIKDAYPELVGNKNNYITANYDLIKLEEIGKGGFG
jgi:hypothetical protein